MYFFKKYRKGIFNKYSKNKSLIDIFLKDISYLFRKILFYFKNGFKNKYIFIYPHYPGRKAGMYQIAKKLAYNLTNKKPKKFDLAVYWEYETYRKEFELLEEVSKKHNVVNLNSRDISKKKVDEVFTKVFGYSLFVNPLEYQGNCVKKGDLNGLHNGEIIKCPIERTEDGFVYQKLINTLNEQNLTEEIRFAVINNKNPYCLIKYKKTDNIFCVGFYKSELIKSKDFFGPDEIEKIFEFCRLINMEFGELDILRDKTDGKIYIVDANNTPQQRLEKDKNVRNFVYGNLAKVFKEEFLKK